jgi:DNA (cytosine-5)-methyltransferase 1
MKVGLKQSSKPIQQLSERPIVAIDLFCGVGGKTRGFIDAGISVVAGIDVDEKCQYAYEKNNPSALFIHGDVESVDSKRLIDLYPENSIKILIGCAPCQPFSTYSFRYGAAKTNSRKDDGRWGLLYAFRDKILDLKPDIVTAENVPELFRLNHLVYKKFVKDLKSNGYFVSEKVVKCADYGVPQTRERLVLLASKYGEISMIPPTHTPNDYVLVRDVIKKMPKIVAGEKPKAGDRIHQSSRLSELNMKRIKATPQGGGWQDWEDGLRLECHKKISGSTYPSVYGRMSWDSLAPTITTQCFGLGNGRFGHPSQDRAISLREAALLQTFPRDYVFVNPKDQVTFKNIGKHIGNAVPPALGKAIGVSILRHLEAVSDLHPKTLHGEQRHQHSL